MFRNPANKNYLEAQTLIGIDYLEGNIVTQNYTKAMEWFEKAASEDYPPAQEMLGYMYDKGLGVNQNCYKAFEWYEKSAEQNYGEGQVSLALMYCEGRGGRKDINKALEWFQKAAAQGNDVAQYNIDLLNKEGDDTNQKPEQDEQSSSNSTVQKSFFSNNIMGSLATVFADTDSEPRGELTIPFQTFFENYFHDESGSYPENPGGGVWFVDNMNFDERGRFFDKVTKVEQKYDNQFDLQRSELVIDTTITKNFGAGVFVNAGGRFTLKYLSSEWKLITNSELKEAYYSESDNDLFINGFEISMVSDSARFYGKRLADCINAYLKQNQSKQVQQEVLSNSEPVKNALDNIDNRLADIREKLATLQNSTEA